MNVLDQIIERKKEEVAAAKSKIPVSQFKNSEFFHRENLSLKESLKAKSGIIAEFKRKSPSKGLINREADVLEVTKSYENFPNVYKNFSIRIPWFNAIMSESK